MKKKLLTKEEVMEIGVDFNKLWSDLDYLIIDDPENKGGKPFTGLAYELYDNGILANYGYYKEGISFGDSLAFYRNGNIESYHILYKGASTGKCIEFYENGRKKIEGETKFGRHLNYIKWDEAGNVIDEKKEPTKEEIKYFKDVQKNVIDSLENKKAELAKLELDYVNNLEENLEKEINKK